MEARDDAEKLRLEKKDPLWIQFHILFDKVVHKEIVLEEAVNKMLQLCFNFLEKYNEKKELKEIIVAFENLKDNLLAKYGEKAIRLYENSELGEILEQFDSRIFEHNYEKEINKLKAKIESFQSLK